MSQDRKILSQAAKSSKAERPAKTKELFRFGRWYALAGGSQFTKQTDDLVPLSYRGNRLSITEVSITPSDRYCFEIWSGTDHVVSFFFDSLPEAARAAADMKGLLPAIEALSQAPGLTVKSTESVPKPDVRRPTPLH